jgi:hypothetical protein
LIAEPEEQWELISDSLGVQTYARVRREDGKILIRGSGIVEFSTRQVMALLVDTELRTKLDSRTVVDEIVARPSDCFDIRHQVYPRRMMVSPRELIALEHWGYLNNTNADNTPSFFFVMASVPCPDHVLRASDAIEMQLEVGGFVLRPSRFSPDWSEMTLVQSLDLGGALPRTFARAIGTSMVKLINRINDRLIREE